MEIYEDINISSKEIYKDIEILVNEIQEIEVVISSFLFYLRETRGECRLDGIIEFNDLYIQILDGISFINKRLDGIDSKFKRKK